MRRTVSAFVLAAALVAPAQAQAWTLLPGAPQAVTVLLHLAGGAIVSDRAWNACQGH